MWIIIGAIKTVNRNSRQFFFIFVIMALGGIGYLQWYSQSNYAKENANRINQIIKFHT
jgi:cell division protein FtsI/penicillin-binding protein 2